MTGVTRKGKIPATPENKLGSNCSGINGAKNRILTLTNVQKTSNEKVFVQGAFLHPIQDYTVSHLTASSTITFLNFLDNTDFIYVGYFIPSSV